MTLMYVESGTAAVGDANSLIIAPAKEFDSYVEVEYPDCESIVELSDSEISDVADAVHRFGEAMSLDDFRDALIDIRDEKGDWRGNLDYLIDYLAL